MIATDAPLTAESSSVLRRDAAQARADAIVAAQVCDQLKGQAVLVLEMTALSPLFDYFVICTANNKRQMHAIADEVRRAMKARGSARRSMEGYEQSTWIVEDFGDVVLHVFTNETRTLYDLENLWGDAPRLSWQADERSQESV